MDKRFSIFDYLDWVLKDLININRNANFNGRILIRQILFTGFEALSIVALVSLLLGTLVISLGNSVFNGIGLTEWMYKLLVSVIIRDIGPIVIAIILLLRSGNAISTELGIMASNSEIYYLYSLGISPLSYLVSPRVIGMVFSAIILMMYFATIGLLGGYTVSSILQTVSLDDFTRELGLQLGFVDLLFMLLKVILSSFAVAVICSFHGLSVEKAITEVPQKSIKAVNQSLITILTINLALIGVHFLIT